MATLNSTNIDGELHVTGKIVQNGELIDKKYAYKLVIDSTNHTIYLDGLTAPSVKLPGF